MGLPAARMGDYHLCPMVTPGTPPIPHVGGPIVGPCVPTVLIGKKPAAVVSDMCVCVGPPDSIVKGSLGVMIGKKAAARVSDLTAHGGQIVVGQPNVLIGDIKTPTVTIPPPVPPYLEQMKLGGAMIGSGAQAALQGPPEGSSGAGSQSNAKSASSGSARPGRQETLAQSTKRGVEGGAAASQAHSPQALTMIAAACTGAPFMQNCAPSAARAATRSTRPAPGGSPVPLGPGTLRGADGGGSSTQAAASRALTCELQGITLTCRHHTRSLGPDDILEVVAPSGVGDSLTLRGILNGSGCGKHPEWHMSGPDLDKREVGLTATMPVPGWDSLPLMKDDDRPREYILRCTACSGNSRSVTIRAYPGTKGTVSYKHYKDKEGKTHHDIMASSTTGGALDLSKLTDALKLLNGLYHRGFSALVGKEKKEQEPFSFLHGSIEFTNLWEEDESDWRCWWTWTVDAGLDPLIGVETQKIHFLGGGLPGYLAGYGSAGFYVSFDGGISLTLSGGRTAQGGKAEMNLNLRGSVGMQVGADINLLKDVVAADANGRAAVTARVHDPSYDAASKAIMVFLGLNFDGLDVEYAFTLLCGVIKIHKTWTIIEEEDLVSDRQVEFLRLGGSQ